MVESTWSSIDFRLADSPAKLLGIERSVGAVPWSAIGSGDLTLLGRPIEVATVLFDALYAIHVEKGAAEGTVYVPFKPQLVQYASERGRGLHLLADPMPRELLGINALFHDQDGRVRTISVPKAHADVWRVGWTVADVLGLAMGLAGEVGVREEVLPADFSEVPSPHEVADLIEGYVLRQQLSKLQGFYISEAQVDVSEYGDSRGYLPRTVKRTLDVLRNYPIAQDLSAKVRYVIATEAETRAMALRLSRRSESSLRSQLHLIFPEAISRLPLWVLQGVDLAVVDVEQRGKRPELFLMTSLYKVMQGGDRHHSQPDAKENEAWLRTALALSVATSGLRGSVAALWGLTQSSRSQMKEHLYLPPDWAAPDGIRADPQADYAAIRKWLSDSDWVALGRASPWHWMLAMVGLLDSNFPSVLESSALGRIFGILSKWTCGGAVPVDSPISLEQGVWPFDGLETIDDEACDALVEAVSAAVHGVDLLLDIQVVRVEHGKFSRDPHSDEFTDASGVGWQMAKAQYTSVGPGDVERVVRNRLRLSAWTESRVKSTGELIAVYWLGSKLGS